MNSSYDEVASSLRESYDAGAAERDGLTKHQWKLDARHAFLARLTPGQRLLEVGAGTGQDSAFFQEQGLTVVATDLSPQMVEFCRAKGIDAHIMDFLNLDFPPASFDAVWALNCLLHVPNADLPTVLASIKELIKPGGLFFIGVYGGEAHEGIYEADRQMPKRFFSSRTDRQLKAFVSKDFRIMDFSIAHEGDNRIQAVTLTRPAR